MRMLYYRRHHPEFTMKFGFDIKEWSELRIFFFYLYRTDGLWWFRFFGGWGLHGKNQRKHLVTFSDRYGKRIVLGCWIFKVLQPDKKYGRSNKRKLLERS